MAALGEATAVDSSETNPVGMPNKVDLPEMNGPHWMPVALAQ
jgi:hypothetical protein